MKAKVRMQFYDKAASVVRKKDDVIDITASRFNEINTHGAFLEAVEPKETEKPLKA